MPFDFDAFAEGDRLAMEYGYGWGWSFKEGSPASSVPLDFERVSKTGRAFVDVMRVCVVEDEMLGGVGRVASEDDFWNGLWVGFYCSAGEGWDMESRICPFVTAEFSFEEPVWFPGRVPEEKPCISGTVLLAGTHELIEGWRASLSSGE